MSRAIAFLYGVASYVVFFGTFIYSVGFIGNIGVPKSLDSPASDPWGTALLIDLGLLALFAIQHSVMARPAFKKLITRVIPAAVERSTYVLASSLALILLFWQWRPLGGTVWEIQSTAGRGLMYGGFVFGWALIFVATYVINHFDLFGLRQVYRHLQNLPQAGLPFETPLLYRVVRHPLYVGWFCAFWFTPTMTVTHLVFAVTTSVYILVAIQFEEHDLMKVHPEYASYRKQVPMLVPSWPKQVLKLDEAAARRLSKARAYAPR
jgi:protein-S-isoprenylcysteine O-methyltransferase Ste14